MRALTFLTSKIGNALAALLSVAAPTRKAIRDERIDHHPKPKHIVKIWRRDDGGPIFGPVCIPDRANHHLTRQSCRHYLRAIAFQSISRQAPLMSRRDRRRWARAAAGIEYLDMMRDTTNLVANERELATA